jgi:hypothetical protein
MTSLRFSVIILVLNSFLVSVEATFKIQCAGNYCYNHLPELLFNCIILSLHHFVIFFKYIKCHFLLACF